MTNDLDPNRALTKELADRAQRASQGWRPGARVVSVEPLTGGASSLTFTARFAGIPEGDEVVVLKVAPPGLPPVRNRDVLRQGTVMRALFAREGVLVPEVLFEDAGDPPKFSPFLAMNMVPGECLEPILVESPDPERAGEFRKRAFDAARLLAAVHRLEPTAIGLEDERMVSAKAEIDRWVRAYETSPPTSNSTTPRWPRRSMPRYQRRRAQSSITATTASVTPSVSVTTSRRSSTGRSGRSGIRGST